ncbi:M6 family metalloprotease domain-containing protein [Streptomyces sp. NPDC098781]|uniref:M6 family metalloprotease domain-containing protein n=1 Tax=Streptomyces sp. NPDC098781 TaxID=3366097 RepID=UPI0038269959
MSREPHPEVDVPRQFPLFRGLGLLRDRPRLRSTAALFTTMSALAATSLIVGPSVAEPFDSGPCALERTDAHHSEGLDTWNAAYPRPTRKLDAVMVFLSFPDSAPRTTPAELTADHFPATTQFFERASYGRFTLRPHPLRHWLRMPRPSTAYAIQRDWRVADRAAYLRDALSVADRKVDFSRYDIVYFVADPDAPGVDSDATKVVNLDAPLRADGTDIRRVVTVFENHPPDRLVLAHETGHVFDLPDLYHRPVDGKGDWDTFVGDWDLMGSQFGMAPDLFGWHKWKLGWLEPRQVVCVQGTGTGSARLTLEPLSAGPGGSVRASAGAAGAGAPGSRDFHDPDSALGSDSDLGSDPGLGPDPAHGSDPAQGSDGAPASGGAYGSGGAFGSDGGRGSEAAVPGFGLGNGIKLAVVRTGPHSALAFEVRGAVGNDADTCRQGVLVYRVRSETESGGGPVEVIDAHPRSEACWEESVYPPLADAPVGLGESFTVPGEGVRVEVEGRTASGAWTVKITTAVGGGIEGL